MTELHWALLGIGAAFIAGLALWEWRRNRRALSREASPGAASGASAAPGAVDRIEPRIDSLLPHGAAHDIEHDADPDFMSEAGRAPLRNVPVIHPTEPLTVPVAREAAVDTPAAATRPAATPQRPPEIRWPPARADRVLNLRLVSAQGALLQGREVRLALEQSGLVAGPQTIFHRVDEQGAVLVSAASLMRPGDLDPALMDEQQFRGLSLFSVLPGPLPPVRMLEELVSAARAVAWRLGATVQDDHGAELDGDALLRLRQSLPEDGGGAP